MGSGIASGVAESLSILAATAPRPGSTVPISRPQRSVTDSKTANSHRFRRATPLNSRRSILMAFNLRPSVLLQESSGSSQAARVRRVNDRRRSAAWLSDSQRYLGLDRGQTTRALRLQIPPVKPFGPARSHEPAWLPAGPRCEPILTVALIRSYSLLQRFASTAVWFEFQFAAAMLQRQRAR